MFEQNVNGFDVSMDRSGSGVVIEHKLLHETCDDSLVSWFAAARILDAMLLRKVQIDSLPKSCGLNFRICFKSGQFPVNNISKSRETSL